MNLPRHVVAIENSPTYQRLLETCLNLLGYNVKVTGTAKEALVHLAAQQVDLVLYSSEMPDMDSLSLLMRLKAIDNLSLCLVAPSYQPDEIELAEKNGLKNYLQKPFGFDTLKKKVEGLIGPAMPKQ